MRRYLVVANQTLGGEQLVGEIRKRMHAGPAHFHVLVPATPVGQPDPARPAGAADPGTAGAAPAAVAETARDLAQQRLRRELAHLRELGADASGEVGVADPLDAIRVVLHRYEFDEVILSTLPRRVSRWIAMDLPQRIRRSFRLPVTVVSGGTGPSG